MYRSAQPEDFAAVDFCIRVCVVAVFCFNYYHLTWQNKSAFLCGVMKTYRQREKQGSKVQESTKGPDETKIKVRLPRLTKVWAMSLKT